MSTDNDSQRTKELVLAEVLQFSQDDLDSNRSGSLSAAQHGRLVRKHSENSRFAWIVTLILLGIGMFGISVEVVRSGDADARALAVYGLVNVVILALVRALILRDRRKMGKALAAGEVSVVHGPIRVVSVRGEKLMLRYFCVGAHRFQIERYRDFVTLKNLGIDGEDATAFVLTGRHELLSVELPSTVSP